MCVHGKCLWEQRWQMSLQQLASLALTNGVVGRVYWRENEFITYKMSQSVNVMVVGDSQEAHFLRVT